MTKRAWTVPILFIVAVAATEPGRPASAEQIQCWTTDELKVRPGEEKVRRGKFAYRTPPNDVPILEGTRIPKYHRKAIRRFRILDNRKLVALTFDIGEQPHEISGYQGKIFDHLRTQNIKATVFLGGKWMLTHPKRTQQFIADPLFEVANHGWEHRNLRLLPPKEQQRSIMRAQSAYEQQWQALKRRQCQRAGKTAHKNAPPQMNLYRFPFGACSSDSLKRVGDAGLYAIQWDISSSDPWRGQTKRRMARTVVPKVKPGSIVLFHANGRGWHTSEAIPLIISQLQKRGFEFVTIGELLQLAKTGKAEPVLTNTCYDSTPGDTNRYDAFSRRLHARYNRFTRRAKATKQKLEK